MNGSGADGPRPVCIIAIFHRMSDLQADFGHTLELFFRGWAQNPENPIKKYFLKNGRLEALDGCKILLRGVGSFCPPGKHHSGRKKFGLFFGCLNSARLRTRLVLNTVRVRVRCSDNLNACSVTYLVPCVWCRVPGTWYQVLGTWYKYLVPGTRYLNT